MKLWEFKSRPTQFFHPLKTVVHCTVFSSYNAHMYYIFYFVMSMEHTLKRVFMVRQTLFKLTFMCIHIMVLLWQKTTCLYILYWVYSCTWKINILKEWIHLLYGVFFTLSYQGTFQINKVMIWTFCTSSPLESDHTVYESNYDTFIKLFFKYCFALTT